LLAALELHPDGPNRFRARNADGPGGVVFGGQLLAQAIVAASAGHSGKRLQTLHMVFARGAAPDTDLQIEVDPIHAGRAFASSTVTIRQGERLCTRATALLSADGADVIRHADPVPAVAGPEPERPSAGGWNVQIVGDVDISDPEVVGPPELAVWSRWECGEVGPVLDAALVAYASDPFLIATAMRPHRGVGQAQAHKTLSTGVIGHTVTFHEPVRADDWALLVHRSPHAGHGRSYGRADIFQGGDLVGSFVQDAMIRPMTGPGPL
jgi:acyl-CoA thioesterase-2